MQQLRSTHFGQNAASLKAQGRPRVPCRSSGRTQAVTTTTVSPQKASSSPVEAPSLLKRHQLLKDPAKIGAKGSASVNVRDIHSSNPSAEDVSLDAYMRLPVEQYYILDPQQIQFLSGNKFVMNVPKINLLGASLQPVIEVEVTSEHDAVVLQATDCQLNAEGLMGGLDSKFALQFTTRLTWNSHTHSRMPSQQQQHKQYHVVQQPHPQLPATQQQAAAQLRDTAAPSSNSNGSSNGYSSSNGNGSSAAPSAHSQLRAGWDRIRSVNWSNSGKGNGGSSSSNGSSGAKSSTSCSSTSSTAGSITGSALVQVWCEVVPPFHLMPREVLERSCNIVITGLVNSLLPWFMRQLAADYQKWASDAGYRAQRRLRTEQKNKALGMKA